MDADMLDQTDRRIVQLLQADGRRSNVDMARELGLSESTIRKRLERLLADGELRIVSFLDPALAGFPTQALILLTVELSQLEDTARLLSEMPEVVSVDWLTGEHDLAVRGAFEDDAHLTSFVNGRLSKLPGIARSRTAHIMRTEKQAYEWVVPDPERASVLVVDDDPDFVETTRLVLSARGYLVRAAASGREALRSMIANPPSLVILDVMMEGVLDGWDASGRIRQTPELHGTPILVVSSITSSDYIGMFPTDEDHLVDNFLSKPVSPERLLQEVARLIARHK
jgi:Lrp/AsnC family transcriptional regulator for asnA, asnC and gidA